MTTAEWEAMTPFEKALIQELREIVKVLKELIDD